MDWWRDKQVWPRISVVVSAVWLGGVMIASQVSRNFEWFPNSYRNEYSLGPAAITAFVGVVVIFIVGFGIPWIFESKRPPGS